MAKGSRGGRNNPENKFRCQAMKLAREALSVAIEWVDKKEVTWALTEINRAVKLLETAR